MKPKLSVLADKYTLYRLPADAPIPDVVLQSTFFSVTRTTEELSIAAPESVDLAGTRREAGWACIKVLGPLDFGLTGILAGISEVMAKEAISIFAVSTFDTDYIMVKQDKIAQAIKALKKAGYRFSD